MVPQIGSYCTEISRRTVNKTLNLFNCLNYASCKLHKEIERITTDYSLYRLLSASILVTLVIKVVINLTYVGLHVQGLCSVLVKRGSFATHLCNSPPPSPE
jgi:hypothetical protein